MQDAATLADTPAERVVDDEDDDRAADANQHAVEVEPGHSRPSEVLEQPASDDSADDAENDIQQESLACLVDDLAGEEPGDEPEDDPG
jgi:hypothetical protein